MENIQDSENVLNNENRDLLTKLGWFVLFLVGFFSLILAIIGTPFNAGVQGFAEYVIFMIPLFIGIPATLLSLIYAFMSKSIRSSIDVLLAYNLLIGCTLLILLADTWMALLLGGGPLASILWIPLFIGIPATVFSIKSALAHRPSRLHVSAMLLLTHILLFALNFVIGAIACC